MSGVIVMHSVLGRCRQCSRNYKARGASGGKYGAQIVIFCILAAVDRFSRISWKAKSRWGKSESRWRKLESCWRKQKACWRKWKAIEEIRKPIGENQISCEENWILGEGNLNIGEGNLDIGEGNLNISKRFSSIWQFLKLVFPTQLVACVRTDFCC